jgi:GT2 family glycosyltransferase
MVSYNVRYYLEQALLSVRRALANIPSEIIVIDNASADESAEMLRQRFPEVILIANGKNTGFASANNQGFAVAGGDFIVLLNPDTIVQEDTFSVLLDFFSKNADASAATCKILNPDGSFSVDCRHSVPTPLTAFWKLTGLSALFPNSRVFGRYNLTYLDENEIGVVEAISGSFMMIRRGVIEKIGKLDENFFMYCEDIDYCHRINQAGGKIYYMPHSQIIHYKGESTKKNNLDYVITFNRSLYQFYEKHYQQKYFYAFKWLILLGVVLRGSLIFARNNLRLYFPVLLDVASLILAMLFGARLSGSAKTGWLPTLMDYRFLLLSGAASLVYIAGFLSLRDYPAKRYSVSRMMKVNGITFLSLAIVVLINILPVISGPALLFTACASAVLMILWRLILHYFGKGREATLSRRIFGKRVLFAGAHEHIQRDIDRLRNYLNDGSELAGVVSLSPDDVGKQAGNTPVVACLEQLEPYLLNNHIDTVIFASNRITYRQMMQIMSRVSTRGVEFKIIPEHFEYIVGKSNIERI